DWLDPVDLPVLVDVGVYDFSLRSSSACAKKALAVRRISLARRSSRFSRSSSLIRSCSLAVTPPRCPLSPSYLLTQVSSVWVEQPILGAIDSAATHSDGYSPRCSCTRRTARSRTSGENFVWLAIAPFSQSLEPPRNPVRFITLDDDGTGVIEQHMLRHAAKIDEGLSQAPEPSVSALIGGESNPAGAAVAQCGDEGQQGIT